MAIGETIGIDSCLYPQFDREVSISNYDATLLDGVITSGSIFLKKTDATQAALLTGVIQVEDKSILEELDVTIGSSTNVMIATVDNIFDMPDGYIVDYGSWSIECGIFAPVLDGTNNGSMVGMMTIALKGDYNSNSVEISFVSGIMIRGLKSSHTYLIPLNAPITILNKRPS